MDKLRVLDLFSGIGGFSLGLERAGMETVAFCEIEPYCRKVLEKHWPNVPIYTDIRELTAARLTTDGVDPIDVICGGFPCQDISFATKDAKGIAGEKSGLWKELYRLIRQVRPRYAIVENTAALRSRGLHVVLADLAEIGYDAEWHCIPACTVGSPHRRDRMWVVAYPPSEGRNTPALYQRGQVTRYFRWAPEPAIPRVDDGIPAGTHRRKALGNSVVPQLVETIGEAVMDQWRG